LANFQAQKALKKKKGKQTQGGSVTDKLRSCFKTLQYMARKFALLWFAVLGFKLNQNTKILKDAYMITICKMTKTQNRPLRYGSG